MSAAKRAKGAPEADQDGGATEDVHSIGRGSHVRPVSEEQWRTFDEQGYVVLEPDQVLDTDSLALLMARIDDIMLGKADLDYSKLMMQLDSATGKYHDIGEQTLGHKGATLSYRKIQNLEHDRMFESYLRHPVFEQACRRMYGEQDVSAFRVMFFNKPAGKGTSLPWHQDRWQHLDRDPLLTVYTAIDPAGEENGCVQVVRRSHKKGVLNMDHHSAFLNDEHVKDHCDTGEVVNMNLKAGQVALLHNWTIHRSGVNSSKNGLARRAFSVNYMDGRTRIVRKDVMDSNLKVSASTGYAQGSDYFPMVFHHASNDA